MLETKRWTANNPCYIASSTVIINTNALMFHSGQCESSWWYFKHLSTHKELHGNNYNASSFLSPSCQLLILRVLSLLSHAVCPVTWCGCGIYLKLNGVLVLHKNISKLLPRGVLFPWSGHCEKCCRFLEAGSLDAKQSPCQGDLNMICRGTFSAPRGWKKHLQLGISWRQMRCLPFQHQ